MGTFITEGLYNGEAPNYTPYYGTEPDLSTLNQWGHFTQIVWKSTASVGCYSADCTASGLSGVGGGVTPFFTVCNYAPPGTLFSSLPLSLSTIRFFLRFSGVILVSDPLVWQETSSAISRRTSACPLACPPYMETMG